MRYLIWERMVEYLDKIFKIPYSTRKQWKVSLVTLYETLLLRQRALLRVVVSAKGIVWVRLENACSRTTTVDSTLHGAPPFVLCGREKRHGLPTDADQVAYCPAHLHTVISYCELSMTNGFQFFVVTRESGLDRSWETFRK